MNTAFEIIGWLSIPLTLVSVIYMVVTWRRQRRLSSWSLWTPILVALLALWAYVALIDLDPSPLRTWLPFLGLLVAGLYLGHNSKLELRDGDVSAARNPWSFLVWVASFTITQLVALLAPGSAEAMLSLLFAATGLTIGEQLALVASRSNVLGAARRAGAAAAAVFLVLVAFGATMSPRTGVAADKTAELGDVAGITLDNGEQQLPSIDGVTVDITGTPEGTYSGPSIDVTIANDTADTLRIRVPVGTKLYPANVGTQTMLTAGNEVIVVPPGKVVKKRIQAYCGEPHDGVPTTADSFTVGETETGPTQRSLEAILEHQDEILDPSTGLTTRDAQHIVWTRRVPDEYEPLDESDPAYKLYNPKPVGPSAESTGKAGGATGGITLVGATGTARSTRGIKRRGGGPRTKPKPGSPEEFHEMMNEPADDQTATKPETEVEPKSVPEEGSDEEFEEAFREPAQNESRKKPETKPEAEPESDSEPKTHPEAKPESKPDKARAVDPNSDTKVTATSGVNRLTVDPVAKAGEFETSKATGSYDAANNNGKFRKKDGSATVDTHPGGGHGEFKGRNKTTKVTVKRSGDIKTLDVVENRKGGGKSEFHGKLAPGAREFEWKDGPDRYQLKLGGGSSLFRHEHPSGFVELRRGPGGTELSAQQRLRASQNAWFRATVGVEHGGGATNPSIRLDHDFNLRLPLPGGRRIRVPLTAAVHQKFGPGSGTTATLAIRKDLGG